MSKEPDVGRTREPIIARVSTQEPIMAEFFYDDEGIYTAYETEYDIQSSEDADTDDDDETIKYRRRRLAELSREMESVINDSGQ
ncbi:hypothetical protein Tco_1510441 [Tanacetum coccineum]